MKRTNKKQSGIIWTVSIVVIAAVLMGALMVHGTRNDAKIRILFVIYRHRLNYFLFILKFICNLYLN